MYLVVGSGYSESLENEQSWFWQPLTFSLATASGSNFLRCAIGIKIYGDSDRHDVYSPEEKLRHFICHRMSFHLAPSRSQIAHFAHNKHDIWGEHLGQTIIFLVLLLAKLVKYRNRHRVVPSNTAELWGVMNTTASSGSILTSSAVSRIRTALLILSKFTLHATARNMSVCTIK